MTNPYCCPYCNYDYRDDHCPENFGDMMDSDGYVYTECYFCEKPIIIKIKVEWFFNGILKEKFK